MSEAYAYTETNTPDRPGYINVSKVEEGGINIYLRECGKKESSLLYLPHQEIKSLITALQSFIE